MLTYISVETRAIIYAFVNISSSSSANSDTIILHDIVGNILRFWIRELARMHYGIRTTGGLARNKSLMWGLFIMRGNETDGRTNFGVSEAKDFILYECMATTSFPI